MIIATLVNVYNLVQISYNKEGILVVMSFVLNSKYKTKQHVVVDLSFELLK